MKNWNTMTRAGLLLALFALGLPFGAMAAEVSERGPASFEAYDTDGDERISETEFDALRTGRIEARKEEGRRGRGADRARPFSDFDTDGNGSITRAELEAGQDACCPQGKADRGRQGMKRGKGQGRGQNETGCRGRGQGANKGRGQGQGKGRNMDMPSFADFDRNGDGILMADEFKTARNERIGKRAAEGRRLKNLPDAPGFEEIDTNDDGKVTAAEFAAHQAEHCDKGQKN